MNLNLKVPRSAPDCYSLALVLAAAGLPVELLPLLLTVDWILARMRSIVNMLGDMMISILIDRAAGKRFI